MPIQLVKISDLTSMPVNASMLLLVEDGSGVEGSIQIQDILNLVPSLDPSLYMLINTYDSLGDGIAVNNARNLNGKTPSYYTTLSNQSQDSTHRVTTDTEKSYWNAKENASNKGAANGYAPLVNGFVPNTYLQLGLYDFKGTYNASSNVPALLNATGVARQTYIVSVGGTQNFGAGNITMSTGDILVFSGTLWQKITASAVAGVTTWNGLSGTVTATTANLPSSANANYVSDAEKLGLDNAATTPSASNPFVTKNDLNTSTLQFQNSYNPNTNTPPLANNVGTAGQSYIVSAAGSHDFGSGVISFNVGDLVILNASLVWIKIANTGVGVSTWNTLSGAVSVTTSALPDSTNARYVTDVQKNSLNAAATAGMNSTTARIALLTDITVSSPTNYKNSWRADTNVPVLADSVGSIGDAYIVSVAGSQNLGSGSITFAVGDFAILNASLIWTKVPNVGVGVSSFNALTGAVNATTNIIPDFLNKRYVSDSTRDAGAAATSPSTSNPFVTQSVLTNTISAAAISIGGEYFSPERFENGSTVGNGTLQMLNTVNNPATGSNYTNISAAAAFPLVSGIDVTTWTLSDACWEQALRTMEGNLTPKFITCHDNRYYWFNQKHGITRTASTSSNNRSYIFGIEGKGALMQNTSNVNGNLFYRIPTSQNEADGVANNLIQYNYFFSNLIFKGVDNGTTQDVAIELDASYGSHFQNVEFHNFYIGTNVLFGLQNLFVNCKWADNYFKGIYLGSGNWTGATSPNSGSNSSMFINSKFRCAPASTAGVHFAGSDGLFMLGTVWEGSATAPNPINHLLVDGLGATTNKIIKVDGVHIEQKCLRSNIRIKTSPQTMTGILTNMFIQGVNNAAFEADGNPLGTVQMWVSDIPDNSSSWLLRSNGTNTTWNLYRARLVDKNNARAAINWDASTQGGVAGTIPPANLVYMSPDILN